jgi:head-tail adaptor
MIRAGTLREKVKIERPLVVPDAVGGQTEGWTVVVDNWSASVMPLFGRADSETESLSAVGAYSVLLRLTSQTAEIDETHRVTWRGKVMRITGAAIDRMNASVRLTCETGKGIIL